LNQPKQRRGKNYELGYFCQAFPPDAHTVDDIPDDFKSTPLGPRAAIIEKIREVAPFADFSDPTCGSIDGDGVSSEVNLARMKSWTASRCMCAEATSPHLVL
jgi:hypothetical protein